METENVVDIYVKLKTEPKHIRNLL